MRRTEVIDRGCDLWNVAMHPSLTLLVLTAACMSGRPPRADDAAPAKPAPEGAARIPKAALPPPDATELLRSTEPFVRPPRPDELMGVATELAARGQERAAKSILASLTTTADDYDRLARRCLQIGQNAAAEAILQDWQRRFPADPRQHLVQAVRYQADGEVELTQRALQSIRGSLNAADQGMADMLSSLVRLQRLGKSPGVEDNPWGVRFVGPNGGYVPGEIAPQESRKIPAGALDATARLVFLLPRQGNLWALLGELYNAAGNPQAAVACLERAELLLYSPAGLREHRRILADHRKQTQQDAERRMAEALAKSGSSNASVAVEGSRARVTMVLLIGSLFIAVILGLQVREWRKSSDRRR